MTGKYYCGNVLLQVVSKVNESRPLTGTSRIMILHDNASARKTGAVTHYQQENRIATLPNLPTVRTKHSVTSGYFLN